jgi:sensor domain CHASE-containing protein
MDSVLNKAKRKPQSFKNMSMEARILSIILITFVVLAGITFSASKIVITNSFTDLENKDTEQNTQRAVNVLARLPNRFQPQPVR